MDHSKGSLILKALSPEADEALLTSYLGKRAKNIPTEKIPLLYKKLPVVLSHRVTAPTARLVITHLNAMGAEAVFQPASSHASPQTVSPLEEMGSPLPLPDLRETLASRIQSILSSPHGREAALVCAMVTGAWLLGMIPSLSPLWPVLCALPALAASFLLGLRPGLCAAGAGILLAALPGATTDAIAAPSPLLLAGWPGFLSWATLLLTVSTALGFLRDQNFRREKDLRQTYLAVLLLLNHFINKSEEQKNHCIRVSIYATRIAARMEMDQDALEELRSAARLHDLCQLKTSRGILHKAMHLSSDNLFAAGVPADHPLLDTRLAKTLPLLLGYYEWLEHASPAEDLPDLPLGTRILAVADAYDNLTVGHELDDNSLPAEEAKKRILSRRERPFDPDVLKAFAAAFDSLEMDLPSNIL